MENSIARTQQYVLEFSIDKHTRCLRFKIECEFLVVLRDTKTDLSKATTVYLFNGVDEEKQGERDENKFDDDESWKNLETIKMQNVESDK